MALGRDEDVVRSGDWWVPGYEDREGGGEGGEEGDEG